MSSLRQDLNLLNDQNIEPNEQCGEVSHVTDSIDHGCVQAYDSMCIEDVVLYLGATASTSGITSRMRLRNHHRSVRCNLKSHGLSGTGGMVWRSKRARASSKFGITTLVSICSRMFSKSGPRLSKRMIIKTRSIVDLGKIEINSFLRVDIRLP